MTKNKINGYVLRLPRKGNFAPIKFGCMEAKFIRTKMPNGLEDMWVAHGRIYTDLEEFNEMCSKVTPSAYKFKLTAFTQVIEMDAPKKRVKPVESNLDLPSPPKELVNKKAKKKAKSK